MAQINAGHVFAIESVHAVFAERIQAVQRSTVSSAMSALAHLSLDDVVARAREALPETRLVSLFFSALNGARRRITWP